MKLTRFMLQIIEGGCMIAAAWLNFFAPKTPEPDNPYVIISLLWVALTAAILYGLTRDVEELFR